MDIKGAGEEVMVGAKFSSVARIRVLMIAGALVATLALAISVGGFQAGAVPAGVTVTPGEAVYEARGSDPIQFTVSAVPAGSETYSFELRGIAGQGTVTGLASTGDTTASGTYTAPDGYTGRAVISIRASELTSGARADGQVIVDVNPKTTLTSGPGVGLTSGLTSDSTPSFEFQALSGSTFACSLDSGAWAPCTSPFTPAALNEGAHSFSVRATKGSGLTDPSPPTASFTVDTVAPIVVITAGPTGRVKSLSASFTFTHYDPSSTVECKLDSGSWAACTTSSTQSYVDVGQGDHTFQVRATDGAGNVSNIPDRSWTADTVASVTIDSGPTNGNTDATPSFGFSSPSDTGLTSVCRVYETSQSVPAFSICSSPYTSAALNKNVSYTFEVKVTDDLGNTETKSRVWNQSNTAPSPGSPNVTISAGGSGEIDISAGATDADLDSISAFTVTSGGIGGISGDGTRITPGVANASTGEMTVSAAGNAAGTYTFSFTLSDGREGGVSIGTATVKVLPDTATVTDPVTPISDSTPEWSFTAVAELADFECRLLTSTDVEVRAWESCFGGTYAPSVVDGIYKIQTRAKLNDLVDDTPLTSGLVEVDTLSPDVDITGPTSIIDDLDALNNVESPAFEFATTDSDARVFFECRTDRDEAGVWTACDSGDVIENLADGERTFEVRAVDAAGNKDLSDSYEWERDTVEPEFEITSGPVEGDWTNLRRPTWEYTESDPNPVLDDKNLLSATTTCQIDSGSVVSDCPSLWTSPGFLNDGPRKLTLTVEDAAGNTGTEEVNFTVSTTAPAAFLEETPDNPSGSSASFEFVSSSDLGPAGKFECRTSANGGSFSLWAVCESPYSPPNLQTGSNTFQVRAVDAGGNAGSGPFVASYTWDVLGTPVAQLTATNTGFGNAAFRFVSGDPVATFECQLDGGAWAACSSPKSYSGLSAGSHSFKVRALNEVATGNADEHTWTATLPAAPDTDITRRPAGTTPQKSASFEFTSDDPLATFECRIDGGDWASCDSPQGYDGLANGDHTFEVRASNDLNQTDSTPASASWTVVDQTVEPVPGQIDPSFTGPRRAKAGKAMTLRVVLRNSGTEDATGARVCLTGPKGILKGSANRCKTLSVMAQSTVSVTFRVATRNGLAGKKARFRATVDYMSAGQKKQEIRGHVTLLR
ncbi:MAG: Ig-like domain repeat protein [Solirubrobacterales bacterium]